MLFRLNETAFHFVEWFNAFYICTLRMRTCECPNKEADASLIGVYQKLKTVR